MNGKFKKLLAVTLCFCLTIAGMTFYGKEKSASASDMNIANGKNNTTYMTSNANTMAEGFLYVGNGFTAINTCNESLTNGNNMIGRTATTDEVALYLDLQGTYNLKSAKLYQGSTNKNFTDSYCKKYEIYYSEEQVTKENKGIVQWKKAGSCEYGKIYSGAEIKNAADSEKTTTGDLTEFSNDCLNAKSIKIVFDKDSCMGTGKSNSGETIEGTVSILSFQVYGEKTGTQEEITTSVNQGEKETMVEPGDDTMNVLFIGNSMTYYNTLCSVVEGLANRYGHKVKCTAATNGGYTLIRNVKAENVITAIKKGGYDKVIIQDIVGSFDADDHMEGVKSITELIKQYNPNAKIYSYEPWPTKDVILATDTTESKLPYFTYYYIKAARKYCDGVAPAGEAFYDMYKTEGKNYYCGDNKHPMPLGTFVSATSVFYTLFPEETQKSFAGDDYTYVTNLIHKNIAYSGASNTEVYDNDELNKISQYSYERAHQVKPAVEDRTGATSYTSVAGEYVDADDQINPDGIEFVEGVDEDKSIFAKNDNIAKGCEAFASSRQSDGAQNVKTKNVTDGNTGTRWESQWKVDPQWLYVDLGSVKEIKRVGFSWEGAYAKKYYIQISDNASDWTTVAAVKATSAKTVRVTLDKTYSARYVRMYGTKRGLDAYGYSLYEMGVWEPQPCNVTVDNETTTVEKGTKITLGNAAYGYYSDGKMYKPNKEYTVEEDVTLTAVNKLELTMTQGASIRYATPYGIRFQTKIVSDNQNAIDDAGVITEGMLITTKDIYEANSKILQLDSEYSKINVENSGWYNGNKGIYCASIVKISESNYIRDYVAKAYLKIKYADETGEVIYSDISPYRSITYVAGQLKKSENYNSFTVVQKQVIENFIK